MVEDMKWSIWKDESVGFDFGPIEYSKDKEVIEEFDSFEEAKIAWKFYCQLLMNKNNLNN